MATAVIGNATCVTALDAYEARKNSVKEYTNSQIAGLIDEHIHNARDRRIMKLHYIDGLSADVISRIDGFSKHVPEQLKIDLSPRHISRILSDRLKEIEKYL